MWLGIVFSFLTAFLTKGRDFFDFSNEIFGSFVAVTGDAHQAKVAQDIFRQEIRYEKSLQIREDIRDVNKMMLESVQTHLFVGSIILGVCFAFFIEGFPPEGTNRLLADLWIVFACWSCSFTLIAQWLALCFQAQISHCARERLLRKHRFQMPDDQVVGKMGGAGLINQIGLLHDRLLEFANSILNSKKNALPDDDETPIRTKNRVRTSSLTVQVEARDGRSMDAVPLKKGMHAWLDRSGHLLASPSILDVPTYLISETLIRSRWFCHGVAPLCFRVRGEATLYIAAQCPPGDTKHEGTLSSAFRFNGQVPEWPEDQLPSVSAGYHTAWRGLNGNGEFRRVNGFSVFVDSAKAHVEMPIYKIVLASPPDDGDGSVFVQVDWRFKVGCEGLLVILRRGHVHCREEDWPIVEFNEEIKQVMPLRDYSGLYTRYGMFCLIMTAVWTCWCRLWVENRELAWWFEVMLLLMTIFPAVLGIIFIPIHQTGAAILGTLEQTNFAEMHQIVQGEGSRELMRAKNFTLNEEMQSKSLGHTVGEDKHHNHHSPVRGIFNHEALNGHIPSPDPNFGPVSGVDSVSKWRNGSSPIRDLLSPSTSPRSGRRSSAQDRAAARTVTWDPSASPQVGTLPSLPTAEGILARLPKLSMSCSDLEMRQCKQVITPGLQRQQENRRQASVEWRDVSPTNSPTRSCEANNFSNAVNLEVGDLGSQEPDFATASNEDILNASMALSDQGMHEGHPTAMRQDELVVQREHEQEPLGAFARIIKRRVPEVIRPIDADRPLHVEGASAKSLRRTLRKFRLWTNFIRILFVLSVIAALAAPFHWIPLVEGDPTAGTGTALTELVRLPWMAVEVSWPAFFHPTAAALGAVDVRGQLQQALWLAADGLLRVFVDGEGSSILQPGPALLLPCAARGLGLQAAGVEAEQRFFVAGGSSLSEVNLSSVNLVGHDSSGGSHPGLLNAVHLDTLRPPQDLPFGTVADGSQVSSAAILLGLDAVAVAVTEPDGVHGNLRSRVHLCQATTAAKASALSCVGHLGQLPGVVRALHGCAKGTCANQPVLWAAVDDVLLAIGLETGTALASMAPPEVTSAPTHLIGQLRGSRGNSSGSEEAGSVVALSGNATHLLAVLEAEGRRPKVFVTPIPMLPSDGVPLLEL